jgi:hypothetical protein
MRLGRVSAVLFKRRRDKRHAHQPPAEPDVWTRNSYFGFVIGLLERPSREPRGRKSSKN